MVRPKNTRFQKPDTTRIMAQKLPPMIPEKVSPLNKGKILTNLVTGERWAIMGGLPWKTIAEEFCDGAVSGHSLYMCATGWASRAGSWKIEFVEAVE